MIMSENDAGWSCSRGKGDQSVSDTSPPGAPPISNEELRSILLESKSRYETLADTVPVGVVELDITGKIVFCNSVGAKLVGYAAPEVLGKKITEFLVDSGDMLYKSSGDIICRKPLPRTYITKIRTKDGKILAVKANWDYRKDSRGKIVGFLTSLVNDKLDDDTAEDFRNFPLNADRTEDGIMWLTMSGEIVRANSSLCRITGYGRDELMHMTVSDLSSALADSLKNMNSVRNREIHPEMSFSIKTGFRNREGKLCAVEVFVDILDCDRKEYICAVVHETRKRKLTGNEYLLESETKYRDLVEHSLVGFYIIQDGFFRFVNDRFCRIHGYAREEIVDKKGPGFNVYPDDLKKVEEHLINRIAKRSSEVEYEFRAIRKDGYLMTVKTAGCSIVFNGRPAVMGTIVDITREKTLEMQLQQAQKMEAIGALAGGVAHDFNNILTALIGYSKLLQMKMDSGSPLKGYVENILASSEKAAGLTRNLLAFSRKQAVQLKPIKVHNIINGVKKLLERLITEDIDLKIIDRSTGTTIMADESQMNQVLLNLGTNARDAMPMGGRLVISMKEVTLSSRFLKNYGRIKPGRYAAVSVADNGQGMDEKTKQKIFDPFYTTKETGKGTGLGLSIVYGIVKEHGGFITVYSEHGRGTMFRIYLPVITGVIEDEHAKFQTDMLRGTETVLIAEDDQSVRKVITEVLSRAGYNTIEAVDGEDAIKKFIRYQRELSLVMLDVVMPKKNGKEVSENIRRLCSDTKIIFVSGYTGDVLLSKGLIGDEYDFLQKPVPPQKLLSKVREVLDRHT